MQLLITGGCGFIGANLVRYLLEESDFSGQLIVLDKLTYAANPEHLRDLEGRFVLVEGDIADERLVEWIFAEYAIDAVCHLAAESHVDRSIASPREFIDTNVVGTFCLLEAARRKGARFHHVSTDEVFGSLGRAGAFTEDSPYDPSSPYSASKAASDHLVRAYHRTYGLPVTLSNCSNNYGPCQFPEKLIPLALNRLLEGEPVPVYGDGLQVRDWLYVRDHCVALWAIMQRGRLGETYNVGAQNEWENVRLVEYLCDLVDEALGPLASGSRRRLIRHVADRPGHDRRYAIDASRLRCELGWKPRESMESGLEKTVEWYLAFYGTAVGSA